MKQFLIRTPGGRRRRSSGASQLVDRPNGEKVGAEMAAQGTGSAAGTASATDDQISGAASQAKDKISAVGRAAADKIDDNASRLQAG